MSRASFLALWAEFEAQVARDGYFGRRQDLEAMTALLRAELEWAGLLPEPEQPHPFATARFTSSTPGARVEIHGVDPVVRAFDSAGEQTFPRPQVE